MSTNSESDLSDSNPDDSPPHRRKKRAQKKRRIEQEHAHLKICLAPGTGTGSEVMAVERTGHPLLFQTTTRDGRCDNIDLDTLRLLPQGIARFATLRAKEHVKRMHEKNEE